MNLGHHISVRKYNIQYGLLLFRNPKPPKMELKKKIAPTEPKPPRVKRKKRRPPVARTMTRVPPPPPNRRHLLRTMKIQMKKTPLRARNRRNNRPRRADSTSKIHFKRNVRLNRMEPAPPWIKPSVDWYSFNLHLAWRERTYSFFVTIHSDDTDHYFLACLSFYFLLFESVVSNINRNKMVTCH